MKFKPHTPSVPRQRTAQEALQRLMDRCARAEICSFDVRRSLYRWQVERSEWAGIVAQLVEQRFVDDGRYAEAYVREKGRLSRWGRRKIESGLRAKQIPVELIRQALAQLEEFDMEGKLEGQIRQKYRSVAHKAKNEFDLKVRLLRYALAQGFDYDQVQETIERTLREIKESESESESEPESE